MRTTFLGWQGWMIESDHGAILIDPLLWDEIGRAPKDSGGRTNFVFPQARQFLFDEFPSVDAVILTHEHEDHFNIPTLDLLERTIPIYVSDSVSSAATTILAEMGFGVRLLSHNTEVAIGDLTVRVFSQPRVADAPGYDEWDTLAYLVVERSTRSGFFSNVDIEISSEMTRALSDERLVTYVILMFVGMQVSVFKRDKTLSAASSHAQPLSTSDPQRIEAALASGGETGLIAGVQITTRHARVCSVTEQAAFLRVTPHSSLYRRLPFALAEGVIPDAPAMRLLSQPASVELLRAPLQELANHFYGRHQFRYLLELRARYIGARRPTFAFVLLGENDVEWVFEYNLRECSFVHVDWCLAAASEQYVAVAVLWASDLLAMFAGAVEPRSVHRAMQEVWAIQDVRPPPSLLRTMWSFFHPLRFPLQTLGAYRRLLREECGQAALVRHTPN